MISPDIKFNCDKDSSCCRSYGRHQKDLMFRYFVVDIYNVSKYVLLCHDQVTNAVAYGWKIIQPCLDDV